MLERFIFDTDPGVDDMLALLMLSKLTSIELVGITTVFGNASIETTTRNALILRDRFGLNCPVVRGCATPISGIVSDHNPSSIHGKTGLGDFDLGLPKGTEVVVSAAQFIIDEIQQHPHQVTLIAVGPLTNLALALQLRPEIAGLVKRVVVMGGAFGVNGVHGNKTPAAEANFYNDPIAADLVCQASWPLTLVGLDVTSKLILSRNQLEAIKASGCQHSDFVWSTTRVYEAFYQRYGIDGICLHDPAAVAYAVMPGLFETRRGPVRVVTDGPARGHSCQKPEGSIFGPSDWDVDLLHNVLVDVYPEAFVEFFLSLCFGSASTHDELNEDRTARFWSSSQSPL